MKSTVVCLSGFGIAAMLAGCVQPVAPSRAITAPFHDDFNRTTLGSDWKATKQDVWTIRDGAVQVAGARNHPLWLDRRLPRNVRIEFDAWSNSPDGDLKCEVFGDGHSYATDLSYTATSYVVIFGGWHNQLNVIARMDEHASDRRVAPLPHVEIGRHYHWAIERRDNRLTWSVDGVAMIEFDDAAPLAGPGHEYFAFNDWDAQVGFDNVTITPL